jgi:hypothetical protein
MVGTFKGAQCQTLGRQDKANEKLADGLLEANRRFRSEFHDIILFMGRWFFLVTVFWSLMFDDVEPSLLFLLLVRELLIFGV